MDRRAFIGRLAGGLLAAPVAVHAQQEGKFWRIGVLWPGPASPPNSRIEAFRQGLRELGYVEGRNVEMVYPKLNLVVGLWNAPGDLNEAKERIGSDARTHIVATLKSAQEQIRMLVEPRSVNQVQSNGERLVMAGACK